MTMRSEAPIRDAAGPAVVVQIFPRRRSWLARLVDFLLGTRPSDPRW